AVHGLYETLAERRRADDQRPVVILQGAGDDLGRRCRATVDEYNERQGRRDGRLRGDVCDGRLAPRANADDLDTLREEHVRQSIGLFQESAWISAQIEHNTPGAFPDQPGERFANLRRGRLTESLQRDVADLAVEHDRERHGRNTNDLTRELHVERL